MARRGEASLLPFAFPRRRAIFGSHGCAIGIAAGGSRVSRSRRTDRSSMMLISCQSPRDVPLRSGNTSGSQRAAPRGCVPARRSDSWNSCGKICARGVGNFRRHQNAKRGRYATGSLRRGRLRRRRGGGHGCGRRVRNHARDRAPRVPALRGRGWNSRGFEGFVLERRQDSGFDGGGGGAATKSVRRSCADVRRGARVARVLHRDQAHAVVDDAPGARERPRSRGRVSTTRAASPILLNPRGPDPGGPPRHVKPSLTRAPPRPSAPPAGLDEISGTTPKERSSRRRTARWRWWRCAGPRRPVRRRRLT